MPAERIEDGDIFKIYKAAKKYVEKIRQGKGPAFLECITCRWKEHVGPGDDFHLGYRSEKEIIPWKEFDQVKRLRLMFDSRIAKSIESKVEEEIKEAFAFAERSLFPGRGELYTDIFKE